VKRNFVLAAYNNTEGNTTQFMQMWTDNAPPPPPPPKNQKKTSPFTPHSNKKKKFDAIPYLFEGGG